MAELSQFPYDARPKVVRARRGDSVVLDCTPPTGVPDPYIYWSVVGDNDRDQFGNVESFVLYISSNERYKIFNCETMN